VVDTTGPDHLGALHARIVLLGEPLAVSTGRAAVHEVLHRWGFRDEHWLELAELIATELVANAVRHAGGTSVLCISADRATVTLSVTDESAEPPVRCTPDDGGGRGLLLVEALSTSWGYDEHPGDGKSVWARLPWCAPDGAGR
jgi:anti-sigma regulatory factor (Ser/Thr protein kinase)